MSGTNKPHDLRKPTRSARYARYANAECPDALRHNSPCQGQVIFPPCRPTSPCILLIAIRGVASVALRSIHHAGECLISRPEQEEVLTIVNKIHKETGWGINFVIDGLIKKWGWNDQDNLQQPLSYGFQQQANATSLPPAPPKSIPSGIPNPMYARADFGQPIHPYQNYYVAPQHHPGGQSFNHF